MPQRAAEDLPKAVAAIRAEGLEVPMITTELVSGDDPTAAPILSTAAKLSIPFIEAGVLPLQVRRCSQRTWKRPAINSADW